MGYYFEVWLRGFAKGYLRGISVQDNEFYHPHITLIRPFQILTSEENIENRVASFCKGKEPIPFTLEGKGNFGAINYIPITNNEKLLEFNYGLENTLESGVEFYEKLGEEKILHATIGSAEVQDCPKIDQYMLRLTGIRDNKIWFSYDFITQSTLNRKNSLDKSKWYGTVHKFSKRFGLLPTKEGYRKFKIVSD